MTRGERRHSQQFPGQVPPANTGLICIDLVKEAFVVIGEDAPPGVIETSLRLSLMHLPLSRGSQEQRLDIARNTAIVLYMR